MYNKMKKNGLILLTALCFACMPALASPPARDVGQVILVDDHSPASLTELVFNLNADFELIVLETAPVIFPTFNEPTLKNEKAIMNLVASTAEPETVPAIRCYSLPQLCNDNRLIKEKIYLVNCSIRQCLSRAVAAA